MGYRAALFVWSYV